MKEKDVKTISSPAESTDLIPQNLKYNPISGETVPFYRPLNILLYRDRRRIYLLQLQYSIWLSAMHPDVQNYIYLNFMHGGSL
jgi:hypothetical protein